MSCAMLQMVLTFSLLGCVLVVPVTAYRLTPEPLREKSAWSLVGFGLAALILMPMLQAAQFWGWRELGAVPLGLQPLWFRSLVWLGQGLLVYALLRSSVSCKRSEELTIAQHLLSALCLTAFATFMFWMFGK